MYQIDSDGTILSYDNPINGELVIPAAIKGQTVIKLGLIDESMVRKIKRLVIPKTVEQINSKAFQCCFDLSEVVIEDGSMLTHIEDCAFKGCLALNHFPFEKTINLVSIGNCAFQNSGLKEIDLSKTQVETIGEYGFSTQSLESIQLSPCLLSIGEMAFRDTSITEIDLSIVSDGCVLLDMAFNHNVLLKSIKFSSNKTLIIEGENVFSCSYELKELKIPASVNIVGKECFDGCFALKTVKFLKGKSTTDRKIPYCTFYGCDKLTNVSINYPFTEIDDSAFSRCEKLEKISLPNSVKRIGKGAFAFCHNLSLVDLSNCNVEIVGEWAFERTSINIEGFKMNYFSSTQFSENSFRNNENIGITDILTNYPFCYAIEKSS